MHESTQNLPSRPFFNKSTQGPLRTIFHDQLSCESIPGRSQSWSPPRCSLCDPQGPRHWHWRRKQSHYMFCWTGRQLLHEYPFGRQPIEVRILLVLDDDFRNDWGRDNKRANVFPQDDGATSAYTELWNTLTLDLLSSDESDTSMKWSLDR